MNFANALEADRRREFVTAANAYEQLLRDHDPEVMLNLAVLYWDATDFGTVAHYQLPQAFVERSADRFRELLYEASQIHPDQTAVTFWRRYIGALEFDEGPLSIADCYEMLSRQPENLEPAMVIFAESNCTEGVDETRRLLGWCKAQGTVRAGYVSGYLDGVTKRARFKWPP